MPLEGGERESCLEGLGRCLRGGGGKEEERESALCSLPACLNVYHLTLDCLPEAIYQISELKEINVETTLISNL